MDEYLRVVDLLTMYFKEDTKVMFLKGGCFFLAQFLHKQIPMSDIMVNRYIEHCGIQIGYHGLYDITGRIGMNHYHVATKRDLLFMKKNYIPKFNEDLVTHYLYERLKYST